MNINNVTLTGNLTRDPEIRYTANGKAVLRFSIACNDRVKNQQGEWVDKPNYIDMTMYGTRADSLRNILTKGMKVAVQGKLHWSSWEKDGQKRSKIEVWPDSVELLSPKKDGSQGRCQKDMGTVAAEQGLGVTMEPVQDDLSTIYDEDIPF